MRIALVSPYSWTYPGGVTRHIEALAGQFMASGHEVRVLAPFDPPDRLSARLHRGARPQERDLPDWVVPLGSTIGIKANGAVSNLSLFPDGVTALRRELRAGRFDVIHLHEPHAPAIGYDALDATAAPPVGTFHCYSDNALSNGLFANVMFGAKRKLNPLHVRIAVSEAAAWTGRRFFGGEYRIIPNGVDVPAELERAPRDADAPLRLAFVGQAVERKGLPVLLRAFEALRDHVAVELIVVGADPEEVDPLLLDGGEGVTVLGKVADEEKRAALARSDVLVAPSLGGESFGMVLTEGFAAGTPVVASDIPGYRDVVRDGVDGVLFPRGDATALAQTLRDLAVDPDRRATMGVFPGRGAARPRPGSPRRAPPPQPRPGQARGSPPPSRHRAQGRYWPRRPWRRRPGAAGPGAHRAGPHRREPAARDADLGPRRPCRHVRLDGGARRGVARDPARRHARRAPAPDRRAAGHVHRRSHVRHVARTPRRAVARVDRGEAHRPSTRSPADRGGHDRLADAAQRGRAGRAGHRHVLDGGHVQRAPEGDRRVRDGAGGAAGRGAGASVAAARRRALALAAGGGGGLARGGGAHPPPRR